MGWITSFLIFAALISFIFYNMDLVNKLRTDIKYIKSRIEEKEIAAHVVEEAA